MYAIISKEGFGFYDFETDGLVSVIVDSCLLPTKKLAQEYIADVLGDTYMVVPVSSERHKWTEEEVNLVLNKHKRLEEDVALILFEYGDVLDEIYPLYRERFEQLGMDFFDVESVLAMEFTGIRYAENGSKLKVTVSDKITYKLGDVEYSFPLRFLTDVGAESRQQYLLNVLTTSLNTLYAKVKVQMKNTIDEISIAE